MAHGVDVHAPYIGAAVRAVGMQLFGNAFGVFGDIRRVLEKRRGGRHRGFNGCDQFQPLFAWHVEPGAEVDEGSLSDPLADAYRLDESVAEVVARVVNTGFGFVNKHDAQYRRISDGCQVLYFYYCTTSKFWEMDEIPVKQNKGLWNRRL